jgi:hypothetical protein
MRILIVHNFYRFRGGEDRYVESLKNLLETTDTWCACFRKTADRCKAPHIKSIRIRNDERKRRIP